MRRHVLRWTSCALATLALAGCADEPEQRLPTTRPGVTPGEGSTTSRPFARTCAASGTTRGDGASATLCTSPSTTTLGTSSSAKARWIASPPRVTVTTEAAP